MKEKLDAFGRQFADTFVNDELGEEECAAYFYVTKGVYPTMLARGNGVELLSVLMSLGFAIAKAQGVDFRELAINMSDAFDENPPKGVTWQ